MVNIDLLRLIADMVSPDMIFSKHNPSQALLASKISLLDGNRRTSCRSCGNSVSNVVVNIDIHP
ncbi:hypothetical protein [Mailhella sp.]|uniref:hypothetical protein n=1 Tax=Mailhella sp. TaxID=1981029 RepID=UPI003AB45921